MGTAQKLGLEHWRFEAMPTARAITYVGKPHSVVVELGADDAPLKLRVQDGHTPGGFAVSLAAAGTVLAQLPAAALVPTINATGALASTPFNIQHELGYYPLVQVLDATGLLVNAVVQHFDNENLAVTVPADGNYSIILR